MTQPHGRADVQVQQLQVPLQRDVEKGAADCDSGVQHHDIERPGPADGLHHLAHAVLPRQVRPDGKDIRPEGPQAVRRVLHAGAGAGDDQVVTVLGQQFRDFEADPGGAVGDECAGFHDFIHCEKSSLYSGCQRDSAGRFSTMSSAAHRMRLASIAGVTSLSGQRM